MPEIYIALPLADHETSSLFRQVAVGIDIMHNFFYLAHMDLKLENIFAATGPDGLLLRIADFGLTTRLRPVKRYNIG
jgi:serine/threonine protein kinase